MTKIEKCLAKLYFALGEEKCKMSKNVEESAFMVEYLASAALRDTGELFGLRYFRMGVSSVARQSVKPHRGKSKALQLPGKLSPGGGKKSNRSGKLSSKPTRGRKTVCDDFDDYEEEDFE